MNAEAAASAPIVTVFKTPADVRTHRVIMFRSIGVGLAPNSGCEPAAVNFFVRHMEASAEPFRFAGVASDMEAIWRTIDILLGLSATKAEELTTGQVCLRAVVVYIVLIAYVRFAKKRFIGQATAFDFILVIIIGSISSRAISGTAPFFASLAGTFMLILMHWVISYFSRSSKILSYLVKGTETTLISDGKIDRKALASSHMSDDDLAEDLRQQGVDVATEVKSARLERSGKLSVIKK